MKKFIKPLLTGIVATLVMVLVMLKVTMDFQLLLFIGAVIFFIAGLINSDTRIHYLLATFIITIIYLLLFIILVLEQLPIWYFVPIYFVIALLGILYKRHKQKIITSLLLLTALMFFLAIKIIPTDIENSLTQTYDYDSKIFKLFKLQKLGIPVILIIDKEQNIRVQHMGYNPAETNFSENMIKTINSLK